MSDTKEALAQGKVKFPKKPKSAGHMTYKPPRSMLSLNAREVAQTLEQSCEAFRRSEGDDWRLALGDIRQAIKRIESHPSRQRALIRLLKHRIAAASHGELSEKQKAEIDLLTTSLVASLRNNPSAKSRRTDAQQRKMVAVFVEEARKRKSRTA